MRVKIYPSRAHGTATAPPSKSMAHRLLICAALAEGSSRIEGVALSEDIRATLRCLDALGAQSRLDGDTVYMTGAFPRVRGLLDAGESGSTLRFIIPICAVGEGKAVLHGHGRLMSRPLGEYERIFSQRALDFSLHGDELNISGPLTAGNYSLRGDVSSQFISGLLFALPLLGGESTVTVTPPFESRAYVDMTLSAQRDFGVNILREGENKFLIPADAAYKARDMTVEGDWSNAAFLDGLGLIGDGVDVCGLCDDSLQSDKVYKEYFKKISEGRPTLDLSECPDLAPVLFALASVFHGAEFTGTRRLRYKESDRVGAMASELNKLGVTVTAEEDRVTVGCGVQSPTQIIDSHNDHRIVMAMTLPLTLTGGEIDGCEAVKKSYPDFFDRIREIGIKAEFQ